LYKNLAQVRMSRSKVKVNGDKKRKSAAFCSGVVLWGTVVVPHFFSRAVLGGVVVLQFYAGGKNQHMLSSSVLLTVIGMVTGQLADTPTRGLPSHGLGI